MKSIDDLKPDHQNARKRTEKSAALIQESLKRYGAARSIVIDEDGRILAGNGTVEGAKAVGIKDLKVIEANGNEIVAIKRVGLTEEQKIGLSLADNRASDLSDWDKEMLHVLSESYDISAFFDEDELGEEISENIEILPPEDFAEVDDDIDTEYKCPSCGYEWSGKKS